jgi:hypothetical protein
MRRWCAAGPLRGLYRPIDGPGGGYVPESALKFSFGLAQLWPILRGHVRHILCRQQAVVAPRRGGRYQELDRFV